MAFLTIAAAATSLAAGLAQTIKGATSAKKIKGEIDSYERQPLKNAMVGIATPQLGLNNNLDAISQERADAYGQLALGGARGLQMTSSVMDNSLNAESKAYEAYERDLYNMALEVAKDDMNIRNIREQQDREALQGLGSELAAARNTLSSGIENSISGLSSALMAGAMNKSNSTSSTNLMSAKDLDKATKLNVPSQLGKGTYWGFGNELSNLKLK